MLGILIAIIIVVIIAASELFSVESWAELDKRKFRRGMFE